MKSKEEPVFMSDKKLSERYEVHRATIWRWAADGKFPKPIIINGTTRWRMVDVLAWEEKR
jgi:predicted DNA-binding transcriptional regulator AlpA